MPDTPMRFIHLGISGKESYSLDSVGKHGFGKFKERKKTTRADYFFKMVYKTTKPKCRKKKKKA